MDYDPETLRLLYGVFAAMWADVDTSAMPLTEQGALRIRMKQHLMEAAEAGERDPEHLRLAALKGMEQEPET